MNFKGRSNINLTQRLLLYQRRHRQSRRLQLLAILSEVRADHSVYLGIGGERKVMFGPAAFAERFKRRSRQGGGDHSDIRWEVTR